MNDFHEILPGGKPGNFAQECYYDSKTGWPATGESSKRYFTLAQLFALKSMLTHARTDKRELEKALEMVFNEIGEANIQEQNT